jgi:beclin
MSFIEITESQIVPTHELPRNDNKSEPSVSDHRDNEPDDEKPPLSWEAKRTENLFSILSSHSDIDHPICTECTSLLLVSFSARLASATRERDAYNSFLKSLQANSPSNLTAAEVEEAERELSETLEKEHAAFQELQQLEDEKRALEVEINELEEESQALELEEQEFWASRNEFDDEMHDLITNLTSLQQKYTHDQQQLERLQRTNVYNDTFCIGHDGQFVTINGLRLGRLPSQHVEWAEINAAWGQTLLLLATVAEKLNFTFRGYRLRPLGSTSRIEKYEWPQQAPDPTARQVGNATARDIRQLSSSPSNAPKVTSLDLFSSGDMPLGRVFYHRRFDAGMVAFLDCLSQLGDHLEKTSTFAQSDTRPSSRNNTARPRVLPYPIHGDKIGDPATGQAVSIKLGAGFQQDENWTKACKYALTCCKFLLAHVSNMGSSKETRD